MLSHALLLRSVLSHTEVRHAAIWKVAQVCALERNAGSEALRRIPGSHDSSTAISRSAAVSPRACALTPARSLPRSSRPWRNGSTRSLASPILACWGDGMPSLVCAIKFCVVMKPSRAHTRATIMLLSWTDTRGRPPFRPSAVPSQTRRQRIQPQSGSDNPVAVQEIAALGVTFQSDAKYELAQRNQDWLRTPQPKCTSR